MAETDVYGVKSPPYQTLIWESTKLTTAVDAWLSWLKRNETHVKILAVTTRHLVNDGVDEWQIITSYVYSETEAP